MITTQVLRKMETVRLPSELSGTVPREVRLSGGGIAVGVIAVAMAVGALVSAILMSVVYTRGEAERQLREREGTRVQAEVVQVALQRGEDHPHRVVSYRYQVDGRRYVGRTVLRQRDRRAITQGEPIAIRYARSQPETSWMSGYEPDGFPLWVIPLVSAVLLTSAAAMAWGVRQQWVLLSEGRVARARITAYKKIRKDKRTAYRVNYEFQTLSGATHTGRYDAGKTPPVIGTNIPIVYHRDNPQWNAEYPLQLVRPSRGPRRY